MTGIALPRSRRKRRRPFGPRERSALIWVCLGAVVVAVNFVGVVSDMMTSKVNGWTAFNILAIVFWARVIIPAEWKVIRAWLDSGDDA